MNKVLVLYWRGTNQFRGYASTYRGAMRIANRTQNAYGPTYFDCQGEQLYDDGVGLAYEESAEDMRLNRRRYAV